MAPTCVISVLGPDGPGLVEKLSSTLKSHGGNWRESRFARLAGQFAGILEADLPAEAFDALRADLAALEADTGLRALLAVSEPKEAAGLVRCNLELIGQDRPGIVHRITDALAAAGANVATFTSRCESAPMSGETLFRATLAMDLAADVDLAALEARLEAIGDELMLDVSLGD